MIIARGYRAVFELEGGRTVRGGAGAEILQDETGREMPRQVCLVMPFRKTGQPIDKPASHVRRHFGTGQAHLGKGELPPLERGWTEIGKVRQAWYTRRGEHAGRWHHAFGRASMFGGARKLPVLYRRGSALKLVLVEGYWDWRGVR